MIHIETIRNYCLQKKSVTEAFPFDEETLVFKVMNKIFLLIGIHSQPLQMNLKMNPELIQEYREKYPDVIPGYHMNKNHWNSVIIENQRIPSSIIYWMIDHSYEEVIKKLSKKEKALLSK